MLITGTKLANLAGKLSADSLHIGSSSIDVRLDGSFYVGDSAKSRIIIGDAGVEYHGFERVHLAPGDRIVFQPGKLYIAQSEEYVRIPNDVGAFLLLRSSAGRRGLEHAHAGWLEPGWEGYITFELTALVPTEFEIGERIAQLVFVRAEEDSQYEGQYQRQMGPVLAGRLVQ